MFGEGTQRLLRKQRHRLRINPREGLCPCLRVAALIRSATKEKAMSGIQRPPIGGAGPSNHPTHALGDAEAGPSSSAPPRRSIFAGSSAVTAPVRQRPAAARTPGSQGDIEMTELASHRAPRNLPPVSATPAEASLTGIPIELRLQILQLLDAADLEDGRRFGASLQALSQTNPQLRQEIMQFFESEHLTAGMAPQVVNPQRLNQLLARFEGLQTSSVPFAKVMTAVVREGASRGNPPLRDIVASRLGSSNPVVQAGRALTHQPHAHALARGATGIGTGHRPSWVQPALALTAIGTGVAAGVMSDKPDAGAWQLLYLATCAFGGQPAAALGRAVYQHLGNTLRSARDQGLRPDVMMRAELGPQGGFRRLVRANAASIVDGAEAALVAHGVPQQHWSDFIEAKLNTDAEPETKTQWLQGAWAQLATLTPMERGGAIEAALKNAQRFDVTPGQVGLTHEQLDHAIGLLEADLNESGARSDPAYARAVGALAPHLAVLPSSEMIPRLERLIGRDELVRGPAGQLDDNVRLDALAPLRELALRRLDPAESEFATERQQLAERFATLADDIPAGWVKTTFLQQDLGAGGAVNALPGAIGLASASDFRAMLHFADLALNHDEPEDNHDDPADLQRFHDGLAARLPVLAQANGEIMASAAIALMDASRKECTRHGDRLLSHIAELFRTPMEAEDTKRLFNAMASDVQRLVVYDRGAVIDKMADSLAHRHSMRELNGQDNPDELTYHLAERLDELYRAAPYRVGTAVHIGNPEEGAVLSDLPKRMSPFWQGKLDEAMRARLSAGIARVLGPAADPDDGQVVGDDNNV
jgi:hypothetical protein